MEPRSYLSQPNRQTERTLLHDLAELNRQFVALVLSRGRTSMLDPCLAAQLGALSDPQLDRLAACPYSLFDAHFGDAERWLGVARASVGSQWRETGATDGRAAFLLAVLLFARQLADGYPDLARLLLGMHNDVAEALGALSLPALAAVAFEQPDWLQARLARHAHFWPDLIDFVREGTRERRLAARTLGVQQSAAKL